MIFSSENILSPYLKCNYPLQKCKEKWEYLIKPPYQAVLGLARKALV